MKTTMITIGLCTVFALMGASIAGAVVGFAPEPSASCWDEDQSYGTGGQHVECEFACDRNAPIGVYVEADDKDAGVSGTASCGDVVAHCSGPKVCAMAKGPTTVGGPGECVGDSDEAFDSGLFVFCTSVVFCGDRNHVDCLREAIGKACSKDAEGSKAPCAGSVAAVLATRDEAVGVLCGPDGCIPVLPACLGLDGGGIRCAIGDSLPGIGDPELQEELMERLKAA